MEHSWQVCFALGRGNTGQRDAHVSNSVPLARTRADNYTAVSAGLEGRNVHKGRAWSAGIVRMRPGSRGVITDVHLCCKVACMARPPCRLPVRGVGASRACPPPLLSTPPFSPFLKWVQLGWATACEGWACGVSICLYASRQQSKGAAQRLALCWRLVILLAFLPGEIPGSRGLVCRAAEPHRHSSVAPVAAQAAVWPLVEASWCAHETAACRTRARPGMPKAEVPVSSGLCVHSVAG